jgi:YVTN family beta-propeller protein
MKAKLKSIKFQSFVAILIVLLFIFSTASYAFYDSGGQFHSSSSSNLGFKSTVLTSSESSFFHVNQTLVLLNNTLVNGNYVPSDNSFELFGVLYDKYNGYLYVTDSNKNQVTVINSTDNQVITTIPVLGDRPEGLTLDTINHEIYVALEYSDDVAIINTTSENVQGNITGISNDPWTLAFDPVNGYIYVAEEYYSTINVYNQTGFREQVIQLPYGSGTPFGPEGVTYDPANGNLYVDNTHFSNVSVINTTTNTLETSISVGKNPAGSFYDPSNQNIYVLGSSSNNVSVINGSTDKVTHSFNVGIDPQFGTYDPENNYLYISNSGSDNITVVNPLNNSAVGSIDVGYNPFQISYDNLNNNMYVTNDLSSTVSIIHSFPLVEFKETGLTPGKQWNVSIGTQTFSSTGNNISVYEPTGIYNYSVGGIAGYRVSNQSGTFSVNDSFVMINLGFAFTGLYGVKFLETGLPTGDLWSVSMNGIKNISVTNSIMFTVPNGNYNYTVNSVTGYSPTINGSGTITVNNQSRVLNVTWNHTFPIYFGESGLPSGTKWTVTVGEFTNSSTTGIIGIEEVNGTHKYSVSSNLTNYFPDSTSGNISVNGKPENYTIVFYKEFPTIAEGSGIAITPNGSFAYVTYSSGKSLFKFNLQEDKLVGIINLTIEPMAIAITPNGTYAYVTDSEFLNGSVAVVNLNTGKVRIFESHSVLISSIAFSPNGHYAYILRVSLNDSYEITEINTSSEMEVNNISLVPGSSSNYPYSMALSPNGTLAYITFSTENITKIYNLSTGVSVGELQNEKDPKYIAMDPNGSDIFVTTGSGNVSEINSSSGIIVRNFTGLNNPQGIAISSNGTYGYILSQIEYTISRFIITQAYTVSFSEKGLPEGVEWFVNLSNGYSYNSTGSTISFTTTNNNYTYSIGISSPDYRPVHRYGNFIVNNSPLLFSVQFTGVNFTITFKETGLPSGTAWYVNITGMPSSGPITSSSYSISLMNSSYTFTVSTENKTFSPTYTSSFTVNGAPVSITVTFSKVLYKVTFTETGLPAGSTWSVVLNGATNTTTSSTISFMEPNGTYSYSVSTTNPAYGPSVSSSSITVSGSAKTVSLSFVPLTFTVTFTETGLPTGTTWYVNLSNGKSLSSTNSTITVSLTNGTYNYTASSNGYKQKTGSITLNDNSVTVSVVFEKITTVTPAKPTSYLVYVLIGVIVATVVVAAAVLVMMRKK